MSPIPSRDDTDKAFHNLRVGDRFSEMCSFWVHVVALVGECVLTQEFGEGKLRTYKNAEEMRARFRYQSIPGYWVRYMGNNPERVAELFADSQQTTTESAT